MPNPAPGQWAVNTHLTEFAISWFQQEETVIDKMFPVVPVKKQTGTYSEINRGDLNRIQMQGHVRGQLPTRAGFRLDHTPTYHCKGYSLMDVVTPEDVEEANGSPFAAERTKSRYLLQQAKLKRESLMSALFTTSQWTTDKVGGTDFTKFNIAGSDPIQDIKSYLDTIAKLTGFRPNVATFGMDAWRGLVENPDVKDRFKHTSSSSITTDMIARLLEIEEIYISRLIQNTADENQTASHGVILTAADALFVYRPKQPSLDIPSAGYLLAWDGGLGMDNQGVVVQQEHLPLQGEGLAVKGYWALVKTAADLGLFLSACV